METNINTRFSTAQMNVAALAIFLAVNQELTHNFPIIILDDPTQNMDKSHSEALTKTLSDLSETRQLVVASHEEEFVHNLTENIESKVKVVKMGTWTTDGVEIA